MFQEDGKAKGQGKKVEGTQSRRWHKVATVKMGVIGIKGASEKQSQNQG